MATAAAAIAALVAAGVAAAMRAKAKKAEAEALMPEEYRERQAELEALEEQGGLGLTPEQRRLMEQGGAAQRGGLLADASARQLQQQQALAGQGALGGRELFLSEMANQMAQEKALAGQSRAIRGADVAAERENMALLMKLQQRAADAKAGVASANWNLAADITAATGQAGLGIYSQGALSAANLSLLEAEAAGDPVAAREAMVEVESAKAAQQMISAYD